MENSTNCSNCNFEISMNFCPNCGQKKYKRIDKKYLKDEIQYTLLHTNKGFFYTVKNLLKNPGKTAKEFIEGNRINHYKPILLLFVLNGISLFLINKVINNEEVLNKIFQNLAITPNEDVLRFQNSFSSYASFFQLLFLPIQGFFTWLVFKKWKYNYYEHIVANAFLLSFITLVTIIFIYPILYFSTNNISLYLGLQSVLPILLNILAIGWFMKEFYNEYDFGKIILKLLLLGLILIGTFILFSLIFVFLNKIQLI